MKKLLFPIVLVACSTVNAQDTIHTAQGEVIRMDRKFSWSIGIEPSLPAGDFSRYSDFGIGGSVQAEFKPISRVGITVNAGFVDYLGQTTKGVKYSDFKYIPVMAGVKYYVAPNLFYIHGQAGPGFGLNGLGTSFWYGGGLGINFAKYFDVELRYIGWEQNIVTSSYSAGGTPPPYTPPGSSPPTTPTPPSTPGYGGHYPTIGLRLACNF